ncbi:hypothetical protein HDE_05026 [Halotydeus destructor]|nr:hypothetical protein HDE_05026 [Halotydeus destructor]
MKQYAATSNKWTHVRFKVTGSKVKSTTMAILREVMYSVNAVLVKSAINVEREWVCCDEMIGLTAKEFKFTEMANYDIANQLLDQVDEILNQINRALDSLHPLI